VQRPELRPFAAAASPACSRHLSRMSPFPEEFALLSPVDVVSPHPEQFLAVNARSRGAGHVVLDVVGQVDAFTAPLLRACLGTPLSRPGVRELVLDVGGVDFLGAAGISAIAEAARRCRERGLRLRLRAHGRTSVLRPLELAGALDGLELEAGVAAELRLAGSVAHA
jgi:anti-sigma B factor antagonist